MPRLDRHRFQPHRITRAAMAATALAFSLGAALAQDDAGAPVSPTMPALIPADNHPQFWFGVAVENIQPAFARQLKLKPDQGVMVVGVFANSPAAKAGIRPEDILFQINGRPLTSQEELARAANTANTVKIGATKSPPPLMQISEVVYLRAGDPFTVRLTPELRPADMRVSGANSQRFTPGEGSPPRVPEVRNIVLSSGLNVQYGPGYQVDANSQDNLKVLREAVGNGQSIIITQETDPTGHIIRITIRDGDHTYSIEDGKLDQVPANLRPLVQKMLLQPRLTPADGQVANDASKETTDERLQRLEQQNEELKAQLNELKTLLLKADPTNAGSPGTHPSGK